MHIQDYQFYKKLTQHPSVKEIWLFGSRARGDNQERADIDLALFCPNASEKEWLDILNIIDDADTLLKIDTVRLDQLSETSPLKKSISQQGKKIYEKL
ncbi:MAG: nucleotidyltransferase domain-containing protein [Alphaproteobacteria bacterium]|nr:MAG: nucleotidyltransferase domain-containing protein [Alphaproteobacteria bacterium]